MIKSSLIWHFFKEILQVFQKFTPKKLKSSRSTEDLARALEILAEVQREFLLIKKVVHKLEVKVVEIEVATTLVAGKVETLEEQNVLLNTKIEIEKEKVRFLDVK
eukprot:Awhi_evm1s15005